MCRTQGGSFGRLKIKIMGGVHNMASKERGFSLYDYVIGSITVQCINTFQLILLWKYLILQLCLIVYSIHRSYYVSRKKGFLCGSLSRIFLQFRFFFNYPLFLLKIIYYLIELKQLNKLLNFLFFEKHWNFNFATLYYILCVEH